MDWNKSHIQSKSPFIESIVQCTAHIMMEILFAQTVHLKSTSACTPIVCTVQYTLPLTIHTSKHNTLHPPFNNTQVNTIHYTLSLIIHKYTQYTLPHQFSQTRIKMLETVP